MYAPGAFDSAYVLPLFLQLYGEKNKSASSTAIVIGEPAEGEGLGLLEMLGDGLGLGELEIEAEGLGLLETDGLGEDEIEGLGELEILGEGEDDGEPARDLKTAIETAEFARTPPPVHEYDGFSAPAVVCILYAIAEAIV